MINKYTAHNVFVIAGRIFTVHLGVCYHLFSFEFYQTEYEWINGIFCHMQNCNSTHKIFYSVFVNRIQFCFIVICLGCSYCRFFARCRQPKMRLPYLFKIQIKQKIPIRSSFTPFLCHFVSFRFFIHSN